MPDKRVQIIVVGTRVDVNPRTPVKVSFSRAESVVWYCNQGEAEIDFTKGRGSPFMSDKFACPNGGFVGSGGPFCGKVGERYKYSITVTPTGGTPLSPLDPEVEVENG